MKMTQLRRNILLNTPHLETATGNIVSFNTDIGGVRLEKCELTFNPIQAPSGNVYGYDVLSFAATGNNKLPANVGLTHYRQSGGVMDVYPSFNSFIIPVPYNNDVRIYASQSRTLSYSFFINAVRQGQNVPVYYSVTLTNRTGYAYTDLNCTSRRLIISTSQNVNKPTDFLDVLGRYVSIDFNNKINTDRPQGGAYDIVLPETIYGGYLDILKGDLYKTWESKLGSEIDWSILDSVDTKDVFRTTNMTDKKYDFGLNNLCSSYEVISANVSTQDMADKTCKGNHSASKYSSYYYVRNSDYANNLEGFIEHIADVRFVYELATPVHYTLEPQTFKTLRGINNIWSNANGDLEISYWKH